MRDAREDAVDYFGDKISKRMKDFAVYHPKDTINERGKTCLEQFRKKSNPEWSQRFFMLILECWKHWDKQAEKFSQSKGARKTIKNFESIQKNKVVLPSTDQYYNEYSSIDPRLAAPINPQQNGRGSSQSSVQQQPQSSNNQQTSQQPKIDETKVVKICSMLKEKLENVAEMLGMASEYEDYMQDIINEFDQTVKESKKYLTAVNSNKQQYDPQVVSNVEIVSSVTEQVDKDFQKFAAGQKNFEWFRERLFECVDKMKSNSKNVKPANSSNVSQAQTSQIKPADRLDPEQAEIPRRGGNPVANINMDSYMSAAINKKIVEEEEEDELNLPEYAAPEYEQKPQKLNQDDDDDQS